MRLGALFALLELPRQSSAGGNRCGHDPRRPRLELPEPAPETHAFAVDFGRAAAELVNREPERFHELHRRHRPRPQRRPRRPRAARPPLLHYDRRRRSEIREALGLVFLALSPRLQVYSLEIGFRGGVTEQKTAELAGLDEGRVHRALEAAKAAGYVRTEQRREEYRDAAGAKQIRSVAARRWLTPRALEAVGMLERWQRYRARIDKATAARRPTPTPASSPAPRGRREPAPVTFPELFGPGEPARPPPPALASRGTSWDPELADARMQAREEHPTADFAELDRIARERLGRP